MSAPLLALAAVPRFGTGFGLARTRRLLDTLGTRPCSTIGVTGSNGKGSTASMASALLTGAGLRTGLFTSPHFLYPAERFRIDGKPIASELLDDTVAEVMRVAAPIEREIGERFSRFELLTVVAWRVFELERVDATVIEVGIGGRFDPTRLGSPLVTAITSLDLEHTELLGNSLDLIFSDKVELTAPGGTCFASLPDDVRLRAHCFEFARLAGVTLVDLDDRWTEIDYDHEHSGTFLHASGESGGRIGVKLPLEGPWQARNAALAVSCAEAVLARMNRPVIPQEREAWVTRSFESVTVPGRFEVVYESPKVIVDAAHTPGAMRLVVDHILATAGAEGLVLTGISANKPFTAIAGEIARLPFPAFVSRTEHGGAEDADIAKALATQGGTVLRSGPKLPEILEAVLDIARKENRTVYVLGGLFFAADVCRLLRAEDPAASIYL